MSPNVRDSDNNNNYSKMNGNGGRAPISSSRSSITSGYSSDMDMNDVMSVASDSSSDLHFRHHCLSQEFGSNGVQVSGQAVYVFNQPGAYNINLQAQSGRQANGGWLGNQASARMRHNAGLVANNPPMAPQLQNPSGPSFGGRAITNGPSRIGNGLGPFGQAFQTARAELGGAHWVMERADGMVNRLQGNPERTPLVRIQLPTRHSLPPSAGANANGNSGGSPFRRLSLPVGIGNGAAQLSPVSLASGVPRIRREDGGDESSTTIIFTPQYSPQ